MEIGGQEAVGEVAFDETGRRQLLRTGRGRGAQTTHSRSFAGLSNGQDLRSTGKFLTRDLATLQTGQDVTLSLGTHSVSRPITVPGVCSDRGPAQAVKGSRGDGRPRRVGAPADSVPLASDLPAAPGTCRPTPSVSQLARVAPVSQPYSAGPQRGRPSRVLSPHSADHHLTSAPCSSPAGLPPWNAVLSVLSSAAPQGQEQCPVVGAQHSSPKGLHD